MSDCDLELHFPVIMAKVPFHSGNYFHFSLNVLPFGPYTYYYFHIIRRSRSRLNGKVDEMGVDKMGRE